MCFVSTLAHNRNKMAHRARKCVFIGMSTGVKGYTLYDIDTGQVFISRDVKFYESIFPFSTGHTINSQGLVLPLVDTINDLSFPIGHFDVALEPNTEPAATSIHPEAQTNHSQGLRRSSRQSQLLVRLHDHNFPYLLCNVLSYQGLSSAHNAFSMAISFVFKPKTYN